MPDEIIGEGNIVDIDTTSGGNTYVNEVLNQATKDKDFHNAIKEHYDKLTNKYRTDYKTGAHVSVFIGPIYVSDVIHVEWQSMTNIRPIYSYNSIYYDALVQGNYSVIGSFAIHYKETDYFYKVYKQYEKLTYNADNETIRGLGDVIANRKNKLFQTIQSNLSKQVTGFDELGRPLINGQLADPERLYGNTIEEINQYVDKLIDRRLETEFITGIFDLGLVFGNYRYEDFALRSFSNVKLVGTAQSITTDDNIILMKYDFIAREQTLPQKTLIKTDGFREKRTTKEQVYNDIEQSIRKTIRNMDVRPRIYTGGHDLQQNGVTSNIDHAAWFGMPNENSSAFGHYWSPQEYWWELYYDKIIGVVPVDLTTNILPASDFETAEVVAIENGEAEPSDTQIGEDPTYPSDIDDIEALTPSPSSGADPNNLSNIATSNLTVAEKAKEIASFTKEGICYWMSYTKVETDNIDIDKERQIEIIGDLLISIPDGSKISIDNSSDVLINNGSLKFRADERGILSTPYGEKTLFTFIDGGVDTTDNERYAVSSDDQLEGSNAQSIGLLGRFDQWNKMCLTETSTTTFEWDEECSSLDKYQRDRHRRSIINTVQFPPYTSESSEYEITQSNGFDINNKWNALFNYSIYDLLYKEYTEEIINKILGTRFSDSNTSSRANRQSWKTKIDPALESSTTDPNLVDQPENDTCFKIAKIDMSGPLNESYEIGEEYSYINTVKIGNQNRPLSPRTDFENTDEYFVIFQFNLRDIGDQHRLIGYVRFYIPVKLTYRGGFTVDTYTRDGSEVTPYDHYNNTAWASDQLRYVNLKTNDYIVPRFTATNTTNINDAYREYIVNSIKEKVETITDLILDAIKRKISNLESMRPLTAGGDEGLLRRAIRDALLRNRGNEGSIKMLEDLPLDYWDGNFHDMLTIRTDYNSIYIEPYIDTGSISLKLPSEDGPGYIRIPMKVNYLLDTLEYNNDDGYIISVEIPLISEDDSFVYHTAQQTVIVYNAELSNGDTDKSLAEKTQYLANLVLEQVVKPNYDLQNYRIEISTDIGTFGSANAWTKSTALDSYTVMRIGFDVIPLQPANDGAYHITQLNVDIIAIEKLSIVLDISEVFPYSWHFDNDDPTATIQFPSFENLMSDVLGKNNISAYDKFILDTFYYTNTNFQLSSQTIENQLNNMLSNTLLLSYRAGMNVTINDPNYDGDNPYSYIQRYITKNNSQEQSDNLIDEFSYVRNHLLNNNPISDGPSEGLIFMDVPDRIKVTLSLNSSVINLNASNTKPANIDLKIAFQTDPNPRELLRP